MSAGEKQASVTRRYFWRTFVAMIAFTALLVLTCLPLLVYGYEVVRYVRSIDEMLARMQVRAAAVATLVMLLASAVFGVAEIYGQMEPLNMTMLLPIAAVAHSIASLVQQVQVR